MEVKISIIIPVYNARQYLTRCLDSVINQTMKELEIICINDGSTDCTAEILNKYALADKRIIVIHQEHCGTSVARNKGLGYAHGEFVGYVDADDTIEKDFYELLYKNAKKYNAEIACGEIRRPDSVRRKDVKNLTHKKLKTTNKTDKKYKLCRIPEKCFIVNKIYKREDLLNTKIEFPEGKTYEDIYWSHVVIDKLEKLVVVPNAIYNYYWNERVSAFKNQVKYKEMNKFTDGFVEALDKSIRYTFNNKIKVTGYKFYTPPKRIRINILGIRFFDLRLWENVKVFYILGFEAIKIYINNNKI